MFQQTSNPVVGVPRLLTREFDFVAALTPTDIRPLEGKSGVRLAMASAADPGTICDINR